MLNFFFMPAMTDMLFDIERQQQVKQSKNRRAVRASWFKNHIGYANNRKANAMVNTDIIFALGRERYELIHNAAMQHTPAVELRQRLIQAFVAIWQHAQVTWRKPARLHQRTAGSAR